MRPRNQKMKSRLAGWVGRLALIAIGLVFVTAGGLKALDPAAFTEQVARFGILPRALAPMVTWTLIPFEVALGVALILDWRRGLAVAAAVGLLIGFLGLMAWTWATGGDVSECGCFGRFVERTPLETILEDILFLGIALLGLLAPRPAGAGRAGALAVAASALATIAFIPLAPSLPLDSIVTGLAEGATLEDLRLSLPDAVFGEGRQLVALLALEDAESGSAADALNALAASPGAPPVVALYADTEEVKDAFFWQHAPAFPMYQVVREEMRPLYRRLPRFFLLEGGVVTRIWETVPSAESLRAAAAGGAGEPMARR